MIWVVFAVLTAGVILAITRPFGASAIKDVPSADVDLHASQLAEIERETGRGLLSAEEAERARTEIARRLLRASKASAANAYGSLSSRTATLAFTGVAAVVAALALGVYARVGGGGFPDQPLSARLQAPVEEQPIEIQVANVERRLKINPNDSAGWQVIAPVYFRLGQFEKSADAYRRVIELLGPSEERLIGLGEALTFVNRGSIGDDAKQKFNAALKLNPQSLRGRFWIALANEQDGRIAEATQTYIAIRNENVPDAWKQAATERLASLNVPVPGAEAAKPRDMDVLAGDQGAMIRGMVDGLAAKLKESPGDVDGWMKLIRSYVVLKETAKAKEAAATARTQFANDAAALSKVNALVSGLRLDEAASADGKS
jgi:cytochrome c-type biogenesis protein CcmH